MEKAKARIARREQLKLLSAGERAARAATILRELANLPELNAAKAVMAFAALPDEVNLRELWQRLLDSGRIVTFPLILAEPGRMDAVPVNDMDKDLLPGRFGIEQPLNGIPIDPRAIDLIFIPALAFDARGNRLGRGGGYYDRFLGGRAKHAFRCGVSFECQCVESLPAREHDCLVHALVTENGVRRFRNCQGLET